MMPLRLKEKKKGKIPTISHTKRRAPSIPIPISTKRNEREQGKKESTPEGGRKQNKKKSRTGLNKLDLIKFS